MGSQTIFPIGSPREALPRLSTPSDAVGAIADLHTHPLLPLYYYRKDLSQNLKTAPYFPYGPDGVHIDMPKLKASGVKLLVSCVYAWNRLPHRDCFENARAQIRVFHEWIAQNADMLGHAKTPGEIEAIIAAGKIAVVLALEGGHHLANRLESLQSFRDEGVFYITIVHFMNTRIAESCHLENFSAEPPLRPFGREVVAEMNRLGIAVDVAHCSEDAFWTVLELSKVPPLYTHGGAKAIADHGRNLTDEQAKALSFAGGILGVMLYPGYLKKSWKDLLHGTVEDVLRHLEHWLALVGPDRLAIGSDMNGVMVLKDVRDYSCMPLLAEAVEKAFGGPAARKILFENSLNYMKRVWS